MENILQVERLRVSFTTKTKKIYPVDDVSFHLQKGKTLALVGESGSGKSLTSFSILGLMGDTPGLIPGTIEMGRVLFHGEDLFSLSPQEMREIRGNKISLIFQEPMSALNPVFSIGYQIEEVLWAHRPELSKEQTRKRTYELLTQVGIAEPKKRYHDYPHQFSGGMRQRVAIAMALACDPEILIADEPTTALDATVQKSILELLNRVRRDNNMAMILISHDLGVVAENSDSVAIMYAGKIVESGPTQEVFKTPQHPYTRGLIDCSPQMQKAAFRKPLQTIKGRVPLLTELPKGCRFQERCPKAQDRCRLEEPILKSGTHTSACFFPLEGSYE